MARFIVFSILYLAICLRVLLAQGVPPPPASVATHAHLKKYWLIRLDSGVVNLWAKGIVEQALNFLYRQIINNFSKNASTVNIMIKLLLSMYYILYVTMGFYLVFFFQVSIVCRQRLWRKVKWPQHSKVQTGLSKHSQRNQVRVFTFRIIRSEIFFRIIFDCFQLQNQGRQFESLKTLFRTYDCQTKWFDYVTLSNRLI